MADNYLQMGAEPVGSTPQDFDAYNRAEFTKWGEIVKAAGGELLAAKAASFQNNS